MILKILNSKGNGYVYHECEEIEYSHIQLKDYEKYDVVDWMMTADERNNPDTWVHMIWVLNNERSNIRLVITTRETYIMNNNGKTIERLK